MNKKKFWIVGILVVIIIALAGFIIFKALNKSSNDETKEETKIVSKDNEKLKNFEGTEIEGLKNVDQKNIYGFADVIRYGNEDVENSSDTYEIVALNSNGEDIEILELRTCPYIFMQNNMLYINTYDYVQTEETEKQLQDTYAIDLNVYPYKLYKITSGVAIGDDFDFTDKYLFATSSDFNGILKYDLENKTQEVLVKEDYFPSGIVVSDDKIYYDLYDSDEEEDYYYSIDLDGNNKESVSSREYNRILKKNNRKQCNISTDNVLIKNGKDVKIDYNSVLYYGDKEVFSTGTFDKYLNLNYTFNSDVIAFSTFKVIDDYEDSDDQYYYYFIKTGKIEEVSEEDASYLEEILLDK